MNPTESATPVSAGHSSNTPRRRSDFASTQWSVVLSAAQNDTETSRSALEKLCRTYWQPLYAFVRRSGRSKEDAEDLVQGFFASFLGRNSVAGVDPQKGRFRAYLLSCLKHYMFNEWKRDRSQKRGGEAVHLPLDWQSAANRYEAKVADDLAPDRLYDREWALTLIERVVNLLGEEFAREGRSEQFEQLKFCLVPGSRKVSHEEMGNSMNKSPEAVRKAVQRLRKRYRKLLQNEVTETLSSPEHLKEEMRALLAALGE
jgi:RNA polymerase sigma factor (sigma-70 family)